MMLEDNNCENAKMLDFTFISMLAVTSFTPCPCDFIFSVNMHPYFHAVIAQDKKTDEDAIEDKVKVLIFGPDNSSKSFLEKLPLYQKSPVQICIGSSSALRRVDCLSQYLAFHNPDCVLWGWHGDSRLHLLARLAEVERQGKIQWLFCLEDVEEKDMEILMNQIISWKAIEKTE